MEKQNFNEVIKLKEQKLINEYENKLIALN